MFAMTASFGLPCVLFTITPEDAVNFRIRVMAKGEAGSQIPPSVGSEEGFHRDYVMESEKIRIENPGLRAIDFENVIGIVVEEILGWDRKNNCNKVGYGLFGDLDAWSFAVEEQGRKTLHAHFLLWVKGYNELIEGLTVSTPVMTAQALIKV
ncbi:hypothetical protein IV203_008497 [Nitzschia inconspicua]|uniref:Helitron helicase-like domain-containing protein n=1 Tax=Nitzschia inconspicua TaxID=303405 RepID=A0A9K3KZQ4_9STRA|nr:hypothetical protein IV203_008497 [Nitzschia inconspicua]